MRLRPTMQIIGAFTVLLVLSNLQCLAACLATPCDTMPQAVKLPPCHRQRPASGSHDQSHCPRQTWVKADQSAPSLLDPALKPSHCAPPTKIAAAFDDRGIRPTALPLDHSPPGSLILRI